jgi:hypothetical protein
LPLLSIAMPLTPVICPGVGAVELDIQGRALGPGKDCTGEDRVPRMLATKKPSP